MTDNAPRPAYSKLGLVLGVVLSVWIWTFVGSRYLPFVLASGPFFVVTLALLGLVMLGGVYFSTRGLPAGFTIHPRAFIELFSWSMLAGGVAAVLLGIAWKLIYHFFLSQVGWQGPFNDEALATINARLYMGSVVAVCIGIALGFIPIARGLRTRARRN